jgi:hypothetical protein
MILQLTRIECGRLPRCGFTVVIRDGRVKQLMAAPCAGNLSEAGAEIGIWICLVRQAQPESWQGQIPYSPGSGTEDAAAFKYTALFSHDHPELPVCGLEPVQFGRVALPLRTWSNDAPSARRTSKSPEDGKREKLLEGHVLLRLKVTKPTDAQTKPVEVGSLGIYTPERG